MIHGGDIYSYKEIENIIDFSSNINPLGYPDILYDEVIKGFDSVVRYPDIRYRGLRKAISDYLGAPIESVIVGNGAMEIIDFILTDMDRVLIPYPAFVEYELRSIANGVEIHHVQTDELFRLDIGKLLKEMENENFSSVEHKKTALIIGNPNNPTGYTLSKPELEKLYEACCKLNIHLVLDETFVEFTDIDYDSISIAAVNNFDSISIVRAATKFFGIPGLRLGYSVNSREMSEYLNYMMNPWSVNAIADIAGRCIFSDTDYIANTKSYIAQELTWMKDELKKFSFLRYYDSRANFILLKLLTVSTDNFFETALKNGILTRKCANFRGLDESYIRIAIKNHTDNTVLINTFKEIEKHGK